MEAVTEDVNFATRDEQHRDRTNAIYRIAATRSTVFASLAGYEIHRTGFSITQSIP